MKTVLANTIGSCKKRMLSQNGREAFSYCGGNTGNVCFVDAIKNQIQGDDEISCYQIDQVKNIEGKIFILPASNWINLDGHVLRDIFLPLEKKNVNLAVLGIGIQMSLCDNIDEFVKQLSANQDTIRALKIMSEHCRYIGVRGGYHKRSFRKIGDKKCKSNWMSIFL